MKDTAKDVMMMAKIHVSTNDIPKTDQDGHTSSLTSHDNSFTVVGTNGKVRWDFLITASTMDEKKKKTKAIKLLQAVD